MINLIKLIIIIVFSSFYINSLIISFMKLIYKTSNCLIFVQNFLFAFLIRQFLFVRLFSWAILSRNGSFLLLKKMIESFWQLNYLQSNSILETLWSFVISLNKLYFLLMIQIDLDLNENNIWHRVLFKSVLCSYSAR